MFIPEMNKEKEIKVIWIGRKRHSKEKPRCPSKARMGVLLISSNFNNYQKALKQS